MIFPYASVPTYSRVSTKLKGAKSDRKLILVPKYLWNIAFTQSLDFFKIIFYISNSRSLRFSSLHMDILTYNNIMGQGNFFWNPKCFFFVFVCLFVCCQCFSMRPHLLFEYLFSKLALHLYEIKKQQQISFHISPKSTDYYSSKQLIKKKYQRE